jgi:hypothetical protein
VSLAILHISAIRIECVRAVCPSVVNRLHVSFDSLVAHFRL